MAQPCELEGEDHGLYATLCVAVRLVQLHNTPRLVPRERPNERCREKADAQAVFEARVGRAREHVVAGAELFDAL